MHFLFQIFFIAVPNGCQGLDWIAQAGTIIHITRGKASNN
jgi:hypothetical protein